MILLTSLTELLFDLTILTYNLQIVIILQKFRSVLFGNYLYFDSFYKQHFDRSKFGRIIFHSLKKFGIHDCEEEQLFIVGF